MLGGSSAALSGTGRHLPALCKKCRQTPIFTLQLYPLLKFTLPAEVTPEQALSEWLCCGGVEDGSTDAERSRKKRAQAMAEPRGERAPKSTQPKPLWF